MRHVARGLAALVVLLVSSLVLQAQGAEQARDAAWFEKKVRPLLATRCYECHSANTRSAGHLRVDGRAALLAGGKNGAAIVPGDPESSLLWQRLVSTDLNHRMPKDEDEALPKDEIDTLYAWIKAGAIWPGDDARPSAEPVALVKGEDSAQYFVRHVKPIFESHCYACHAAATKPAGGLRVDTSLGIAAGGHTGALIKAGDPEHSLLLKRVRDAEAKTRMPKESEALTADEIAVLTHWIAAGGKLPDETEPMPQIPASLARSYEKSRREHWAFQPVTHPVPPTVGDTKWVKNNIDRYILAVLEERGIRPVADADAETLIRRVTFDLTGLPPTPEAIHEFKQHHTEKDYERLVDSLLNSQQYAERWARHWLDVARYGESTGPSRNIPYPHAWRYRDYVIDAVRRDVPYDRFLREQVAGDLLPASTTAERDRLRIATGFLALGVKDVNQRFEARYQMDRVDEQIDTVSRSVLAMTTTCARCHDHKFDPIPMKDYYALAGIFTSTSDESGLRNLMGGSGLAYYDAKHLALLSSAEVQAPAGQLKRLDAQIAAIRKAIERLQNSKPVLDEPTKEEIAALNLTGEALREKRLDLADAGTHGYGIHAVAEGSVGDTAIRIRGTEERHGPLISRGYLSAIPVRDATPIDSKQSGRLQLSLWLTSAENPLTARVAVNRIWAHLFGQGIVTTVDNFGTKGTVPTNPALLDALATDFIARGWSQKAMIREIVLSHTYRLSSAGDARGLQVDQANQLEWRHTPRRLEAEEVRDAVLASSGQLDRTPLNGSAANKLKMIELNDNSDLAKSIYDAADQSRRRSIYLPLLRGLTPRALAAFDPVSQSLVSGQRDVTVVPTQALFMLNSSFVSAQSLALATQLSGANEREKVQESYRRVLGREAQKSELQRDEKFLADYAAAWKPAATSSSTSKHAVAAEDDGGGKLPIDPADDVDQGSLIFDDAAQQPRNGQQAALAALVQALFASAEFQYVR